MSSLIFSDLFNNATGADLNLTAYNSNYTVTQGAYTITPSGWLRNNSGTQAYIAVPATTSSAGTVVSFDIQVPSQLGGYMGIVIGSATAGNPYTGGVELRYTENGSIVLYRMDTVGNLHTQSLNLTSGNSSAPTIYHFEFFVSSSTISYTINGSPQASMSYPSGLTFGNFVTIESGPLGGSNSTDTAGIQIKNLFVYQGAATNVLPPDSIGLGLTPGHYINPGTSLEWMHTGNGIKVGTTGTTIGINVDVSPIGDSSYPWILSSLDNGPWVKTQLTTSGMYYITGGAPVFGHNAEIRFEPNAENNTWNIGTSFDGVRISGIQTDYGAGAGFVAPTGNATIRPKKALIFGDSITRGYNCTSLGGNACQLSFAALVGHGLNAETGIVAYSGQGVQKSASSPNPAPSFINTFTMYDSVNARNFGTPDYVLICHGTNDGGASATTLANDVTSMLTTIRNKVGANTLIVWASPSDNTILCSDNVTTVNTAILNGFNAYKTAFSGDDKTSYYDLSSRNYGFLTSTTTQYSTTAAGLQVHPNTEGHALLAADLVSHVKLQEGKFYDQQTVIAGSNSVSGTAGTVVAGVNSDILN
jgi:lysophospholipase L1-like esterase